MDNILDSPLCLCFFASWWFRRILSHARRVSTLKVVTRAVMQMMASATNLQIARTELIHLIAAGVVPLMLIASHNERTRRCAVGIADGLSRHATVIILLQPR